jgi:hypothetical protein
MDPKFAEARAICAREPVTTAEMLEVLDELERRVTGERERAMGPIPSVQGYREPVVLEAVLNHLRRGGRHLPDREYGR